MFASERFDPAHHDVSDFDCGKPSLTRWLKDHAADQAARGYSSTYVWVDGDRAVAYFTLMTHTVRREDVPKREGRGGPELIPALLLAKFALDRSLHNQGLGAELLVDVTSRCIRAIDVGPGARLLLVDAIDDEAAAFYEHFGFRPVAEGSSKLLRRLTDIREDLLG